MPKQKAHLRIVRGMAEVLIKSGGSISDWQATVDSMVEIIDSVKMHADSIEVMFLWVLGDASQPVEAHEDDFQGPLQQQICTVMNEIDSFPWPVFGMADGCIGAIGSLFFAVSSIGVATTGTQFWLPPCCEEKFRGRGISSGYALKLGLVTTVVQDRTALIAERLQLCKHFQDEDAPTDLSEVKMATQFAWSSLAGLGFDFPQLSSSTSSQSQSSSPLFHGSCLGTSPKAKESAWHSLFAPPWLGLDPAMHFEEAAWDDSSIRQCKVNEVQTHGRDFEEGFPEAAASKAKDEASNPKQAQPKQTSKKRTAKDKKESLDQTRSPDVPITTLMLCNLPCCVDHGQVARAIDKLGFARRYDLLHILTGSKPVGTATMNLGYGFINFLTAQDAEAFSEVFNSYRFEGVKSMKRSMVRPAYVQGFLRTTELFRHSLKKRAFRGSLVITL